MKKTLALILAFALLLGVPALAFSDVADADLAVRAATLQSLGVLDGYADGTLQPDAALTRAQFSKLTVLLAGYDSSVSQYARRTLFSDVPGGGWAAGYVNLAYEKGYISGYGNGKFGPDDPVTYGQAVTILLRLLGYTSADIGSFWPDDYVAAAERLGIGDGVDKGAYDALTRGEAVTLLTNLLWQDTASGKSFLSTLAAAALPNALVTAVGVTGDDGSTGNARVAVDGDIAVYAQLYGIPDALVGRAGTLLLDSSGRAAGFVPDEGSAADIVVAAVTANSVTARDGKKYTIGSGAVLVCDGEYRSYELGFANLYAGRPLRIFKNTNGVVTMLWVITGDDAELGDTALTGVYEAAYPNAVAPSQMTLMGHEFALTAAASAQLAAFSLGNQVTVVLTTDGRVGRVVSPNKLRADAPVGVLTSTTTVQLLSGLTVGGVITTNASSTASLVGSLVTVVNSGIGKLSVSAVGSAAGGSASLNVTAGTLGGLALSDDVRIFERAGKSAVTEIALGDIPYATVAASNVAYYHQNSGGAVDLLVLEDVTGDRYTYGIYNATSKTVTGDVTYTNYYISVTNAKGTTATVATGTLYQNGAFGGIALTAAGTLAASAELTKYASVTRADFTGLTSVSLEGVDVAVAENAQAYNSGTEKWVTLAEAKAYADEFTVYVYKNKVRIVVI